MATPSDQPLLSIIVPAYKRKGYLEAAIESIGPASPELEIVVVDDGSPTPLRPVARPDLIWARLDVNSGPARARNFGVAKSNGAFVSFLDSDDMWPSGRRSCLIGALSSIGDDKPDAFLTMGRHSEGRTDEPLELVAAMTPSLGDSVFRRAAWPGLADTYLALQDVELWFRLASQGKPQSVVQLDCPRQIVRLPDGRARNLNDLTAKIKYSIQLMDDYHEFLNQHPRIAAFRLVRLAYLYFDAADLAAALAQLALAVRTDPSRMTMSRCLRAVTRFTPSRRRKRVDWR